MLTWIAISGGRIWKRNVMKGLQKYQSASDDQSVDTGRQTVRVSHTLRKQLSAEGETFMFTEVAFQSCSHHGVTIFVTDWWLVLQTARLTSGTKWWSFMGRAQGEEQRSIIWVRFIITYCLYRGSWNCSLRPIRGHLTLIFLNVVAYTQRLHRIDKVQYRRFRKMQLQLTEHSEHMSMMVHEHFIRTLPWEYRGFCCHRTVR